MKHTLYALILFGLTTFMLAACGPPCSPMLNIAPENSDPPHNSMVADTQPVLSWTYAEECDPPNYWINLWTNSTNGTITATGFGGETGGPDKFWQTPVLDSGTAYLWQVAAKNSTHTSPYSDMWQFIVGPACTSGSFVAPIPELPAFGDTIATLDPMYTWGYPDPNCTPAGYHLQVSELADFSVLTVDVQAEDPIKGWITGIPLTDCEDYYWRVAAYDGVTDGPWSTVSEFSVNAVGACLCDPSEILAPIIMTPATFEVVADLLPSITWTDPTPCVVEGYAMHLSPDREMTDTTYWGGANTPGATSWAPGSPLQPITRYWVEMAGMVGTDMGPLSNKRPFFTGPECTSVSELVAPDLISPADNEEVTDGYATLEWDPGSSATCQPDGYFVNLQTASDFSGTNLLGEFLSPATTLLTEQLLDCEKYYWKVAGIEGSSYGPESAVRSFRTNESGTCVFLQLIAPFRDIACYFGPHPLFHEQVIGYILAGEEVEPYALSLDGRYAAVQNPDAARGFHCWALLKEFDESTIPFGLSRWEGPPLPTREPEPTEITCNPNLSEELCPKYGGKWNVKEKRCDCPR